LFCFPVQVKYKESHRAASGKISGFIRIERLYARIERLESHRAVHLPQNH
jgi:hypothetical protein